MKKLFTILTILFTAGMMLAANRAQNTTQKFENSVISHRYLGTDGMSMVPGTRTVVAEHFTNASCGPCATYNPTISSFMNSHQDDVLHIAYHVWWPGSDPMYSVNTAEVTTKVNYYGITGVPDMVMDGVYTSFSFSSSSMNTAVNYRKSVETPINITVNDEYVQDSVKSTITVEVLEELTANTYFLKVMAVDAFCMYPTPAGANGEDEFLNVFREAYPNTEGVALETTVGVHEYTYTYALNPEWNNGGLIYTAALVQNASTKEILNGGKSKGYNRPQIPVRTSPENESVFEPGEDVELEWMIPLNTTRDYRLQLASDNEFENIITDEYFTQEESYSAGSLGEGEQIFWRIKSFGVSDSSFWSPTWNYSTTLMAPTDLAGEFTEENYVKLTWTDNSEAESGYVIVRSFTSSTLPDFSNYDTTSANATEYIDMNTAEDGNYQYKIYAINGDVASAETPKIRLKLTDIEDDIISDIDYKLAQNYPNPFNPSTSISYNIPQGDVVKVELRVFDVLGNEVATLVNENKSAGVYTAKFDASGLSSGIYFYTLSAGKHFESKKMLLLK